MTRQDAIYDVITILRKFGYTDDDALDEDYIGYKIDEKRAKEIRDSYNRNPTIDPVWIQDYGIIDLTKVNYSDDQTLQFLKCLLYKYTLPPCVSFSNALINAQNLGITGMYSADLSKEYYFQDYYEFVMRIKKLSDNHPAHLFQYFTQMHRAIYSTSQKLRAQLILERPLDGYVLHTEKVLSTKLIPGESYYSKTMPVTHNGITYLPNVSFVAINPFYIGLEGDVYFTNYKRKMTNYDEYPFSNSQMEILILKLLTQEFKIEEAQVIEHRNDSSDKSIIAQQANDN